MIFCACSLFPFLIGCNRFFCYHYRSMEFDAGCFRCEVLHLHAVPMIIGEVRRYLRDNSAYRIPRSLRDTAYQAIESKEKLSRKLVHDPSLAEISKDCGIPENDILYALDAIQTPLSLFDPVYTDGGDTLYVMDQISDKKNKEEAWVKNLVLDDALKLLDDRARQIIKLWAGRAAAPRLPAPRTYCRNWSWPSS